MKAKEIITIVKNLNLPEGKYALFGSVPLAMHGIRESRDIDVILNKDIWQDYVDNKEWEQKIIPGGRMYLMQGDVELMNHWFPGEWDIEKLIREAEMIDGLPCVRLEEVIRWKKAFKREKDFKDLELINNYLKK